MISGFPSEAILFIPLVAINKRLSFCFSFFFSPTEFINQTCSHIWNACCIVSYAWLCLDSVNRLMTHNGPAGYPYIVHICSVCPAHVVIFACSLWFPLWIRIVFTNAKWVFFLALLNWFKSNMFGYGCRKKCNQLWGDSCKKLKLNWCCDKPASPCCRCSHPSLVYIYIYIYTVCNTPQATSRKMSRQHFSPSENLDCGILFGLAWLRLDIFIAFTRTSLTGFPPLSLSLSLFLLLQVPLGGSNPMTYI